MYASYVFPNFVYDLIVVVNIFWSWFLSRKVILCLIICFQFTSPGNTPTSLSCFKLDVASRKDSTTEQVRLCCCEKDDLTIWVAKKNGTCEKQSLLLLLLLLLLLFIGDGL